MSDRKIFEDFSEVDCNECEHWWMNQCDGASKGSRIGCNSFLATRSVVIPARIETLEKSIKWLTFSVIFTNVAFLIHILVGAFNG